LEKPLGEIPSRTEKRETGNANKGEIFTLIAALLTELMRLPIEALLTVSISKSVFRPTSQKNSTKLF
jgi:hypothetical protein